MKKQEILKRWQAEPVADNVLAKMVPLHEKHEGKTFGLDGIRIDGSEEFIFAVLSRLKDLIDGENNITRLQLSMSDCSKAEGTFNKGNGGNVCYVRLHMRTQDAAHVSAFFDKHLHAASERYAKAIGA